MNIEESFKWAAPLEFYKKDAEGANLYKGRAISARISGNKVKYTAAELKIAARSLASRPINLNHKIPLPFPANCVVDADFENNVVEDIIKISDEKVQKLIEDKKIQKQSIEGQAREGKPTTGGAQEAVGLHFTGLALVTNDETPGDPTTDIKLWETIQFYETTVEQLLNERPELGKATNDEGQTLAQMMRDAIIVAQCARCNKEFDPEETKCPHCGELFEIKEIDLGEPYPNEHACRLKEPNSFEDKSFRRITQGKLNIIIGKLKGKSTTTTQAYRYPKDAWSAEAARAHCEKAGGSFEAASAAESQSPKTEVNKEMSKTEELKVGESKETTKDKPVDRGLTTSPVTTIHAETGAKTVSGTPIPKETDPTIEDKIKKLQDNSIRRDMELQDDLKKLGEVMREQSEMTGKDVEEIKDTLKNISEIYAAKVEVANVEAKAETAAGKLIGENKDALMKLIETVKKDTDLAIQAKDEAIQALDAKIKEMTFNIEAAKNSQEALVDMLKQNDARRKDIESTLASTTKLVETVSEKLTNRTALKKIPFKGVAPGVMETVQDDKGEVEDWEMKSFKRKLSKK